MKISIIKPEFSPVQIILETQEDVNRFNNILVTAIDSGELSGDDEELSEGLLEVIDPIVTGREEEPPVAYEPFNPDDTTVGE